jgi:hypothetical protein
MHQRHFSGMDFEPHYIISSRIARDLMRIEAGDAETLLLAPPFADC